MKVALDRHKISMLKNKIYQYLSSEILKNFMTILLTFTLIAWVVRAVNFLDLMIDDGYSAGIYFKYSILNISTITTRFIPLAFLLSLIISILKFERQQELLILWTAGLGKLKVANIFCLIALFVTLFQIILGLFVNPFSLNVSRSLLRESETMQINSMLKLNDFSDAFKGLTFYIDKKNSNNELLNVFIKDTSGSLNTIIAEASDSKNSTIIAEKGYVANNKLFLFEGTIQSFNKKNEIKARQGVRYPNTEGAIVMDPETMKPVPKDGKTMGEIMIRGNIVMKGYYKDKEATDRSMAGGWFHSGDLAVTHPDGYIKIQDRSKDIIISGGENISSIEIENAIAKHSSVSLAAVVAKPDEKWGETPCAFVELIKDKPATEKEIIDFCRETLAGFKIPKSVIFCDLPKTSTGKIQKFELRKKVKELS